MRRLIVTGGLPTLLLLMAIAVILILSGAGSVGFVFGLVVAGLTGVILVSSVFYEVAHFEDRYWLGSSRVRRGPHARSY
jgi:hypothetical protein